MRTDFVAIEKEILQAAINELKKRTGASVKHLSIDRYTDIDAHLEINFGKISYEFYVEIKGEVHKTTMERLIDQFQSPKNQWLLVAKYIPRPLKEYLKTNGYNYLEATGNCYIRMDQILIHINDQEVKHVRKTATGKLWKSTGLKFLFVILQDPSMLTKPYRTIAHAAGIASGNISNLMQELTDLGYISMDTAAETPIGRSKLIDRWAEMFEVTLKPKLIKGHFRFLRSEHQQQWRNIKADGIYWGGEPGADLYTHFLNPEKFTLYATKTGNELVPQLKIVPDEKGDITILDKFWNDWPGDRSIANAAPPLLIYAELKNSLDSRNWETAEKLKQQFEWKY
ncbi:MAG TPA: type IV toxin-antitoxin system AbiEi family antitoxin [Puia sp.]|nr:type IV toxin-antitoxin system AbiEi family antitoxin [Puia sp.]